MDTLVDVYIGVMPEWTLFYYDPLADNNMIQNDLQHLMPDEAERVPSDFIGTSELAMLHAELDELSRFGPQFVGSDGD